MLWIAIAAGLELLRVIVCGMESWEKLSDVGVTETAPLPATAVPVSAMATGSLVALLAIVRYAYFEPVTVGLKITWMVQVWFDGSVEVQELL